MKSTGIVRKLDQLGRIVIPKELRKTMDLHENDGVEIFTDGEKIILKKYSAYRACVMTGEVLDSNVEFAPGLVLSPAGIQMFLNKIKENQAI